MLQSTVHLVYIYWYGKSYNQPVIYVCEHSQTIKHHIQLYTIFALSVDFSVVS